MADRRKHRQGEIREIEYGMGRQVEGTYRSGPDLRIRGKLVPDLWDECGRSAPSETVDVSVAHAADDEDESLEFRVLVRGDA